MLKNVKTFLGIALALSLADSIRAEHLSKPVLSLTAAKRIAAAAEAEAMKRGATVVIAVVDDGGHVLVLERLDDTQVASVDVAIGKARTAAIFRRPSKIFEDQIRDGRVAALALPGATPLQGGIPIMIEGRVVGAIGVSGNTPQEDEDIAKAGALASPALERLPESGASRGAERIAKEVRHGLVMLPYYGVFDNLAYAIDGHKVTLLGQVTRPTLRADSERIVKKIEGVDGVENRIEVLPISPNDDRIRLALYRAIYGHTALSRYALRAVPTIHIIVKNGNATLEGAVGSEFDRNIAGIQANGVSGVFSVTNSLHVDGEMNR